MVNQKNRTGFRHCSDCKQEFALDQFYKNKGDKGSGRAHQCPTCINARVREWTKKNSVKWSAYQKVKRAGYIARNMDIVKKALNNSVCGVCGDTRPLRFKDPNRVGYFDPVMSVAKTPRPEAVVEETIAKSIAVCITC